MAKPLHDKGKRDKTAIALRYDRQRDQAPQVTAKGKGAIAEKIIALAREAGVPIHEDRDLAAMLAALDIDMEIPPELYRAVAEVLAFLYQLNKKHW
jgi:flagellar biosynthesis protein